MLIPLLCAAHDIYAQFGCQVLPQRAFGWYVGTYKPLTDSSELLFIAMLHTCTYRYVNQPYFWCHVDEDAVLQEDCADFKLKTDASIKKRCTWWPLPAALCFVSWYVCLSVCVCVMVWCDSGELGRELPPTFISLEWDESPPIPEGAPVSEGRLGLKRVMFCLRYAAVHDKFVMDGLIFFLVG